MMNPLRHLLVPFLAVLGGVASFSPLSTFYDIEVSTTASYFTGSKFGPGCGLGGAIPDGFVAVAMNGVTTGLSNAAGICGMCVAIKGPMPSGPNPADNTGVVGEYYGYVYEVCQDCTQAAGLQLGIPGAGQNSVVWRAIPCPTANGSALSTPTTVAGATGPYLSFEDTHADHARFQVRGLSAPIVEAAVAGRPVTVDGAFLVLDGAGAPVFPFTVDLTTALDEQLSIQVPAYREYGAMADLITVTRRTPSRPTTVAAPNAQSRFGSGQIDTVFGPQMRSVRTTTQAGRQVVTITTGPASEALPQPQQQLHHGRPSLYNRDYSGGGFLPNPDEFLAQPVALNDFDPSYGQVQSAPGLMPESGVRPILF